MGDLVLTRLIILEVAETDWLNKATKKVDYAYTHSMILHNLN